jgi:hypothetical protein
MGTEGIVVRRGENCVVLAVEMLDRRPALKSIQMEPLINNLVRSNLWHLLSG